MHELQHLVHPLMVQLSGDSEWAKSSDIQQLYSSCSSSVRGAVLQEIDTTDSQAVFEFLTIITGFVLKAIEIKTRFPLSISCDQWSPESGW